MIQPSTDDWPNPPKADDSQTATVHPNELPAPDQHASNRPVINGYLVCDLIGTGGCSDVFLGVHGPSGRRVALKVLKLTLAMVPEMHERFEREILAVKVIQHPNIVPIYDSGKVADGRPFFSMELIEGRTVRDMLKTDG